LFIHLTKFFEKKWEHKALYRRFEIGLKRALSVFLIWFGAPLYSNDELGKGVKIEKFAPYIQLKALT
jgi:hypothetical protein